MDLPEKINKPFSSPLNLNQPVMNQLPSQPSVSVSGAITRLLNANSPRWFLTTEQGQQDLLLLHQRLGNQGVGRLIKEKLASHPEYASSPNQTDLPDHLKAGVEPLSDLSTAPATSTLPLCAGTQVEEEQLLADKTVSDHNNLANIRVPLKVDVDGDGKIEDHVLRFEGRGEEAALIINPDPTLLEKFITSQPALQKNSNLSALIAKIHLLQKGTISQTAALSIKNLLQQVAAALDRSGIPQLPASKKKTWKKKTITANKLGSGTVSEDVTKYIKIAPLTYIPGDGLMGSSVRESATPYMNELHHYAGYIRGHMLNHKLHGPGDDNTNLVPISRKMNSWMSASGNVEAKLKEEVWSNRNVVSYEVIPDYSQSYQGAVNSEVENKLPSSFTFTIKEMEHNGGNNASEANQWKETSNTPLYQKTVAQEQPMDITGKFDPNGKVTKSLPLGIIYPDESDIQKVNRKDGKEVWVVQGDLKFRRIKGLGNLLLMQSVTCEKPTLFGLPKDSTSVEANLSIVGTTWEVSTPQFSSKMIDEAKKSIIYMKKNIEDRATRLGIPINDDDELLKVLKSLDNVKEKYEEIKGIIKDTGTEERQQEFKREWQSFMDNISTVSNELESFYAQFSLHLSEVDEICSFSDEEYDFSRTEEWAANHEAYTTQLMTYEHITLSAWQEMQSISTWLKSKQGILERELARLKLNVSATNTATVTNNNTTSQGSIAAHQDYLENFDIEFDHYDSPEKEDSNMDVSGVECLDMASHQTGGVRGDGTNKKKRSNKEDISGNESPAPKRQRTTNSVKAKNIKKFAENIFQQSFETQIHKKYNNVHPSTVWILLQGSGVLDQLQPETEEDAASLINAFQTFLSTNSQQIGDYWYTSGMKAMDTNFGLQRQ